jgi:hypothetical protein
MPFLDAGQKLGMWKITGKLKDRQTLVKGLEKAPNPSSCSSAAIKSAN